MWCQHRNYCLLRSVNEPKQLDFSWNWPSRSQFNSWLEGGVSYLSMYLLLNGLLLNSAIYRGTVCLLCTIKCLSLCMPLIHSLSMHWGFPFWLAGFVSIHLGFTRPNFLSGCTLSLKRRQKKKSFLIIHTTENSALFCSYWVERTFFTAIETGSLHFVIRVLLVVRAGGKGELWNFRQSSLHGWWWWASDVS